MYMNVSHVTGGTMHNHLSLSSVPWIIDASSDPINSDVDAEVRKRVVRVLTLGPGLSLRMHEDTGDSIARHIWWVSERCSFALLTWSGMVELP